jgi:hypothetical protein
MIFSPRGYRNALGPTQLHPAAILRIGADAAVADVRVVGKAATLSFSVQENVNIVGT